MQLARFPRFRLAHLPTPLEHLDRLSRKLDGPQIYMKRDDCTGLAFGGNKTRKLEYLIADALTKGATTLVSVGGMQSNHVRQTAAAAVKAGLASELVLNHNTEWDDPAHETSGNFLLDGLLGAKIHVCVPGESRDDRQAQVIAEIEGRGEVPYFIPSGGSNAIGGLGFVGCALEILEQGRARDLAIDYVVVASGSGGTQGGLVAGLAGANSQAKGIGIDIDDNIDDVYEKVSQVAHGSAALLGIEDTVTDADIDIRAGYASPGYGMPNPNMIEALEKLARTEGIILDPVYSGKAMAGLIDMIRKDEFGKGDTVVFIHTGGTPALFAYPSLF